MVVGAGRHHGDHDRQRHCRHALAAGPAHAADEHHHDGRGHRCPHRDAEVPREPRQPRPPHRLGSRLVRRLPALHLLLHDPRPLHRHRRMDHPVRRGVQVGHDPRFGHACRSAPGPVAGSSGSGPRSRPSWPRPLFRSCSTTPSPFTAGICSPRWRGSTRFRSACRWPCCSSGSLPAPSGRGGTAAGPPSCWPAASSPTSFPACTPWAARSSSRSSNCCPSRWGIADRPCTCGAATAMRSPCPGPARCGGRARRSAIGLLLTGWWLVPFGLEHAYSSSMGYTNVEGWAQYFREADAWALVLAGIGLITAVVTRSRFGITITVLGIVSAVATAVDPQGALYNVRLLPLWFISVYFMAAWAFGTWCMIVAIAWRRAQDSRWEQTAAMPPWSSGSASTPALGRAPLAAAHRTRRRTPRSGSRRRSPQRRLRDGPAMGPCRGQRRHPRFARRHGGRGAALHLPGVVASR